MDDDGTVIRDPDYLFFGGQGSNRSDGSFVLHRSGRWCDEIRILPSFASMSEDVRLPISNKYYQVFDIYGNSQTIKRDGLLYHCNLLMVFVLVLAPYSDLANNFVMNPHGVLCFAY